MGDILSFAGVGAPVLPLILNIQAKFKPPGFQALLNGLCVQIKFIFKMGGGPVWSSNTGPQDSLGTWVKWRLWLWSRVLIKPPSGSAQPGGGSKRVVSASVSACCHNICDAALAHSTIQECRVCQYAVPVSVCHNSAVASHNHVHFTCIHFQRPQR